MSRYAQRFDGLAEAYDRYRPDYPPELFEALFERAPEAPPVAVDVAAGSGISTKRLLLAAPAHWRIEAVEPGADMRRVLAQRFAGEPRIGVRDGFAEAIGLEGGSAAVMIAATAFHWFDRPRFFAEAARILAAGGLLALVRNKRAPQPVLAAFDAYIAERSPEDRSAWSHGVEDEHASLRAASGFEGYELIERRWLRPMSGEDLVAMYFTRSTVKVVADHVGAETVRADLMRLYTDYFGQAPVEIAYDATLALARRATALSAGS